MVIHDRTAVGVCGKAESRSRPGDEGGLALISALMLILLSLTLGAATLLTTMLDTKSTQHFVTGNQALYAAEAGMIDVINRINSVGIVNFQNEVAGKLVTTGVSTLLSPAGSPEVKYTIGAITNATSTSGNIQITGLAPLKAERVITTSLARGAFQGGAGALHLTRDTVTAGFSGASFTIDGRNHADNGTTSAMGTLDPTRATQPGISTRNDTVRDTIKSDLTSTGREANVVGLAQGGTGDGTNSVWTTSSASINDMQNIVNSVVNGTPTSRQNILNQNKGNLANSSFGTKTSPAVTVLNGTGPSINGGAVGYGVLIVNNDVTFSGNFTWYGWVIFTNPNAMNITLNGGVVIHGMLWTSANTFKGSGGFQVDYCYDCLVNYGDKANGTGGLLPAPVNVASWSN